MKHNRVVLGITVLLYICMSAMAQLCPPVVHKDDVIVGNAQDMPDGWFVYALELPGETYKGDGPTAPGMYISSIKKHEPKIIPNTENDPPKSIDITTDGKWIVYRNIETQKIYIIRPDGTGKTEVPLKEGQSGWYRGGPNGLEVYSVTEERKVISSVPVNLDTDPPSFGTVRKIVEFSGTDKSPGGRTITPGFHDPFVHSDHVFAGRILTGDGFEIRTLLMLTIPDGGKGTATYSDRWEYSDTPDSSAYGCGRTMSHDGEFVVFGAGSQGNPDCVPNRENGMDHKGFNVVPFLRKGDPPIGFNALIDKQAFSTMWCPPQYRYGKYNEVDFSEWYVSNNPDYIVGVQKGRKGPCRGVWACHKYKAVWTLLTGDCGIKARTPAMHMTNSGVNTIRQSRGGRQRNLNKVNADRAEVYSLRGRRISSNVAQFQNRCTVESGVYVIRENGKASEVRLSSP